MTPMVAECDYIKCLSNLIGYLENNWYWYEYDNENCFNSNVYFHDEIIILTGKTVDDHLEMLALENG